MAAKASEPDAYVFHAAKDNVRSITKHVDKSYRLKGKLGVAEGPHNWRAMRALPRVGRYVRAALPCLFIEQGSAPLRWVLACRLRTASVSTFRQSVYGSDFVDINRRAGDFVVRILRGAKAGDIPVEQPRRLSFAINMVTAKALSVTVPPTLLARADKVIE